jgi:hypothetical protein
MDSFIEDVQDNVALCANNVIWYGHPYHYCVVVLPSSAPIQEEECFRMDVGGIPTYILHAPTWSSSATS